MSSWAFWGGLLSNATEIHVNAPPHHSVMYGMNQYVYHNEKTKEYFGTYSAKENDILYRRNLTNHHHLKLRAKAVMHTHSNHSDETAAAAVVTYVADKANSTATSSSSAGPEAGSALQVGHSQNAASADPIIGIASIIYS